ncbi:hypothetical protein RYH80_01460 [Halobaculum sp. MBLA0147]
MIESVWELLDLVAAVEQWPWEELVVEHPPVALASMPPRIPT